MAKKKHKKDSDADLPVIMDYGIGCISIYDPVDMMPYNDPPVTEQTRFKKSPQGNESGVQMVGVFYNNRVLERKPADTFR